MVNRDTDAWTERESRTQAVLLRFAKISHYSLAHAELMVSVMAVVMLPALSRMSLSSPSRKKWTCARKFNWTRTLPDLALTITHSYTTYELEVSGILARNWDTTFCRAIKWTVTSPNGVKTYPFEQFDIYPAGGKNNAPVPINAQPIRVSIPSKDNVGVYRVKVSLDIECMGEDFDLRLANFKMTPE